LRQVISSGQKNGAYTASAVRILPDAPAAAIAVPAAVTNDGNRMKKFQRESPLGLFYLIGNS